MGWPKKLLVCIARTAFGLPLAAVLSAIGMAIASALAVFFGVSGLSSILTLLMVGAGVGAGIGSGAVLIRVDTIPSWFILLGVGLGLSAIGFAGAWAGFQIGDKITAIEEANCVGVCEYLFKPRTYIALGATIVTSGVVLVFNIGYEFRGGRWTRPRGWSAGPAVGSSGEASRFSQ